jgi:hypothetical protein
MRAFVAFRVLNCGKMDPLEPELILPVLDERKHKVAKAFFVVLKQNHKFLE